MAAPPCTLRAAWLLVPPLPVRPQGLPSKPPPINLNQTVQVVSVFVPPLRSGTKPIVHDLLPTRIVRDCQTTADAADPHPPSLGSLQKKAEREAGRAARSSSCSKDNDPVCDFSCLLEAHRSCQSAALCHSLCISKGRCVL
jgi:hypothetical protein